MGWRERAVFLLLSCFSGMSGNVPTVNLRPTVAAGQSYAYWVDGSVARQVLPSSRGVVNYVYPQEINVVEGWYRVVLDNPQRVSGDVTARLDDERGAAVNEKAMSGKDARTSFYQRLTPGKHKLRIGTKAEWIVTVTVTADRP